MILFQCPGCGMSLRAKPEHVLKQFRCPKCRVAVTVPDEPVRRGSGSNALSVGDTLSAKSASSVTVVQPRLDELSKWEPGTVILDDYVIEKLLGKGGMAEVYLARSRSTDEQFAVKRILPKRLRDRVRRRLFLHELRNWLDLPEHPHLTACRFFRTVEDQLVIFAEYVEGGSLEAWIRDGRIATLESMLDVAIQMAWGLDAAHRNGLIHQDVKPANVLLREDILGDEWRLAKITDFGLAQAWRAVERIARADETLTAGKSHGAGTPAYCSPEQYAGAAITPKTDVWGWGITVLEMLLGKRTWEWGPEIVQTLKKLLHAEAGDKPFFIQPTPSVVEILRRCFQRNPEDRLSLNEAAEAALAIYERKTGRHYPRQCPAIPPIQAVRRTRAATFGGPAVWLAKAATLVGSDSVSPPSPTEPPRSRRTQLIEDIIEYDDALDIYSRLVAAGRVELKADLSALCDEKARVHRAAGDFAGALVLLDHAMGICDELHDRPGMAERAASILTEKALLLAQVGKRASALDAFDRAIAAHRGRSTGKTPASAGEGLADCYAGRASTLTQMGNYAAAEECFDRAIEVIEPEVQQGGRPQRADDLADVYRDKAGAMALRGALGLRGGRFHTHPGLKDLKEARTLSDRALALYGRLGGQGSSPAQAVEQARCFVNHANVLHALGDDQAALRSCDFALAYLKPLGPDGAEHERAVCRLNRAVIVGDCEGENPAIDAYDEALAALEALVLKSGRGELRYELAMGSLNKATALGTLGDDLGSLLLADRAIKLCERLVHQEGRLEALPDLAACYANRAVTSGNRGQIAEAMQLFGRATQIWDQLERDGRDVPTGDVALCLMNQGGLRWRKGEATVALKFFEQALDRLGLPMFHRVPPDLTADAVFCDLNRALVYSHLNKRRSAARALDRVDDLLGSCKPLRDGPLLRGPMTAPLFQFVVSRARPGSRSQGDVTMVADPNRAFQRTRKRLIHLVGSARGLSTSQPVA